MTAKLMITKPRGYVVYEGPSRIGRKGDIVVIITGHSVNEKTGDMYQMWVLDQSAPPTEIARYGLDDSICGDCKFRPSKTVGTPDPNCYVTLIHGPNQIWKGWKSGNYPWIPESYRFERALRMAAYGEPAALPQWFIKRHLIPRCDDGWTGYTHQWRRFQELRHYFMASVDTLEEMFMAHEQGWRTFRTDGKKTGPWEGDRWFDEDYGVVFQNVGEIGCPAAIENGKRTTCLKCLLCNGMRPPSPAIPDMRKNIQIYIHG